MKQYLFETKSYHEKKYKELRYSFQRKLPNEDIIRFAVKYLKKKSKILDIGCGTGRNAIYLIELNHTVDCLDFSENGINLLKLLFKKKKISKIKNNLIIDSIPLIKKVSKNYDAVIDCFTSYSLMKEDFQEYIKKIVSKIKKKGVFHLQILSKKSHLYKFFQPSKIIKNNSVHRILRKSAPFYGDEYLFTFYSKNELTKILNKSFSKVNIETHSRSYRNSKEYLEFFVIDCIK